MNTNQKRAMVERELRLDFHMEISGIDGAPQSQISRIVSGAFLTAMLRLNKDGHLTVGGCVFTVLAALLALHHDSRSTASDEAYEERHGMLVDLIRRTGTKEVNNREMVRDLLREAVAEIEGEEAAARIFDGLSADMATAGNA
jgi:hypothetical protein